MVRTPNGIFIPSTSSVSIVCYEKYLSVVSFTFCHTLKSFDFVDAEGPRILGDSRVSDLKDLIKNIFCLKWLAADVLNLTIASIKMRQCLTINYKIPLKINPMLAKIE